MPNFAVILPAAGSSSRFGADKLSALLGGRTVLDRTVSAFQMREDVRSIVIASRFDDIGRPGLAGDERVKTCLGGACRAESVWNALKAVPESIEWVAVHDAARPLVSQGLIDRVLAAALEHGAAVPALPVALTIKRATDPLPAKVIETVPRHCLWAMQTPQIMRRSDLLDAFQNCPIPLNQVTDDVQLLELTGQPVWLVAGEEQNLKLTTPMDLKLAELLLNA